MLRLSPRTVAEWWIVMRVTVWGVPPARAGRAPHASRHNRSAEAPVEVGVAEVMGSGGGLAVGLASGPAVAVGLGVGVVEFAQAATVAARPALPASRSSQRRLTSSG